METFLNYYEKMIQPQIAAADIFLRTEPQPYPLHKAAEVLQMPLAEAAAVLQKEQSQAISKMDFLRLMQKGASPFCRMFRRELASGLPTVYTPEQISFIYDLDIAVVTDAMVRTGFSKVPELLLPLLFGAILLKDTQYQI